MPFLDNPISFVGDEVAPSLDARDRPGLVARFGSFAQATRRTLRHVVAEPEVLLFALGQWIAVAVTYVVWAQFLRWIPEEVWAAVEEGGHVEMVVDLLLLAWSFACVGVAAFPIGILTGAMAASHLLRRRGQRSTIAGCVRRAGRRAWPLWMFAWLDGWITVDRLFDRLPGKRSSRARRAAAEAIYYAWKVGTLGVIPALVEGRSLVDAGRRSVKLVKARPIDVVLLRGGYSAVCWTVGLATYVASIVGFFWLMSSGLRPGSRLGPIAVDLGSICLWLGLPIAVAALLIHVVVRPIYVLNSCELYAEALPDPTEGRKAPRGEASAGASIVAVIALLVLVLTILAVMAFRDELGVTDLLRRAVS